MFVPVSLSQFYFYHNEHHVIFLAVCFFLHLYFFLFSRFFSNDELSFYSIKNACTRGLTTKVLLVIVATQFIYLIMDFFLQEHRRDYAEKDRIYFSIVLFFQLLTRRQRGCFFFFHSDMSAEIEHG